MELNQVIILITAFVLDAVLGDPRALPHLIVWYGNGISTFEKLLNKGKNRFAKGALLTIFLVSLSFIIPTLFIYFLKMYELKWVMISLSIILLFYCLANRTLVKECIAVFETLENEGLEKGRERLSWIVGRETTTLSEQQIRIATLETMSENLSDGVIAPLFYFLILGVPGAMAYKMINTFDSMIGYKNERYEQFGKFAAKLDDVVNYIPARITAFLMLVIKLKVGGVDVVFREGKKHSSPNAGYPEAALAYILKCRFGGPNYYHGKLVEKPYIGFSERKIEHKEIYQVKWINYGTSILFVVSSIVILLLVN